MTHATTQATQAGAARLAGALFLFVMATGIVGEVVVRGSLVVWSDVTQSAQNIIGSGRLFRIGIVSDLVTFTGVIVLAWALYVLLRPVDRSRALLAAFFRLAEATVCIAVTVNSLLAIRFLGNFEYLKVFEAGQLHALSRMALNTFGMGFSIGFMLAGLGSTIFAYLLWKSRYVPRVLAGWGVFASLLFTTHALLLIVFPEAANEIELTAFIPMGIYEVTLGAWLLIKGVKIEENSPAGTT